MNNNENAGRVFTLISSDATVQYTKDVFSVLALPRDSNFQFRYASKYIDPDANAMLVGKSKINIRALVVFKSAYAHYTPDGIQARTSESERFYVPIRWVRIYAIKKMADGFIIHFKTEGYPRFKDNIRYDSFEGMNKLANEMFSKFEENDYSLWSNMLPGVELEDDPTRDNECWRSISKYISLIPEYSTYHLLKCSSPYVEKWDTTKEIGKKEDCEKRGVLTEIVEGKCVSIDVEYFAEKYNPDQQRKIEVFVDENVLSRSRGLRTSLQSRYGSIKLSFQPKTVANNTISEIVINTSNFAGSELQTEVTFPVIIVKNRAYKLFKALLSAIGALFIALPGIIGDNQSYKRNIVLALIGIIIAGICSYWESREG